MIRYLKEHAPHWSSRVWANLATLSILAAFAWLVYGWTQITENQRDVKTLASENRLRATENRQRIIDIQALARQTNKAFCTFRGDLNTRAAQLRKTLWEQRGAKLIDLDPDPKSMLLVARDTLENSLANQQRTLDSLADLNCKEG